MLKRSWVTLCWLVFLAVYGSLPAAVHTASVSAAQSPAPVPGVNHQSQSRISEQTSGYATAPNLRFDRLSVDDGLSFSFTTSILQDRQGFMWFGTRYGLNQFDGFDFSVHMLGSGGDVLFANYIRNMYQDRTGDLWISNLVDLVRKDHETGEFVHYKPDSTNPQSLWPGQLYAIAEDAAGNLWISTTDGLNRYEPSTDTFTHHLTGVSVLSFMADRQGGTWVGTGGDGLWHFPPGSPVQGQPKKYLTDPSDLNSLSDTMVLSVIEDHEGILWVGTFDGGLNRLDPTTGKFTRFQHDPQDPLSLSHNNVNTILEDSRGRLWIGTDDGLNLLDRKTGRFFQYHHNPGDPHSLSSDTVWEIYEDRSGVLWFGTLNGISKLNETASRFTHYQQSPNPPAQGWGAQSVTVLDAPTAPGLSDNAVSAVYQDRQGLLWIGTNTTYRGELNRLDRSTGRVTVYQYNPDDPSSLTNGPVYTIYEDSAGTLWVGTLDGLARFRPQTGSFDAEKTFTHRVTSVVEDQQGTLWVGYWGGLYRRERGASDFTSVRLDRGLISTDRVHAIYPDQTGSVWVSIENGGLYRLDPSPEDRSKRVVIKFPQDANDPELPDLGTVMSFYEDAQGRLWMGSVEGGLVLFNRDTQTFTHYVPDTGPGRFVSCIQGDDQGFLWMATELGLARFDPRTETFSYFDARDGLVIGEGTACFRNQQGEMFFGSSKGVNTFFPDQIQSNPNPPPVVITALNLKNQSLRDNLLPNEQIRLSYRENYLSFDFAALDYNAPAKNQYAYKMEGLDAEWIQAGTRHHADYPDLQPGTYTFRVKASNNSGVWNEQGTAVHITITPPFWQTWWFIGLVGLALAGGVAGGVRLRLKNVERRGRELEDQVASRTRELVALNGIATLLNRPHGLKSVLSSALEKTLEVIRIEAGGIYLLDEKAQVLDIAAYRGFSPQFIGEIDRLQVGEGFSGAVIRSGRSLVVRDVSVDPRLTRVAVREEGFHSLAVVPLASRDQIRGTLFAMTHGHREFSEQDIQLLESIGHQIGAAIENARLYEDTRRQVTQLTALQETAKAVSGTLELDGLLHLIIQQATSLMRADGGFINLVDWDNRMDECVAVAGIAPPVVGARLPLEGSLSGWVSLHNQAVISNQISNDDRVEQSVRTWVMEEHIQSAAGAPLVVRDQVKGSLLVVGREKGRGTFDQADLDLLISFANQATIAIENAFLYEKTRALATIEERRRQELEALLTADDRMQRCLHEEQVLQALVDVTVDILHADKSAVFWWDEKREKLVMRLARGFHPTSVGEFQFARDKGIMGWVVTHRQPVVVEDASNDPRRLEEDPHIVEIVLAEGIGSFIHYPILIGQDVPGVFNVVYQKTHAAGEDELRLFQALLQRAALYIENARLYEQSQEVAVLEERARLARELHDAVTQTLFSASLLAEALPVTWEKNPSAGRELLQDLRGLSRGALAEMRTLLLELRPAALMETRLEDLLRQLGEAANGRSGIPVTVKVEGQAELPRDVQIAFYRITQEALNNVVKHARAQQATVHLHYQRREPARTGLRVVLTVRDDGRGFDPARIPPNHLGLGIMKERARSIGALMTIESQPGRGTRLTVQWEQLETEEEK